MPVPRVNTKNESHDWVNVKKRCKTRERHDGSGMPTPWHGEKWWPSTWHSRGSLYRYALDTPVTVVDRWPTGNVALVEPIVTRT
jgi:hypothetical protein